jgi:prophage antirepressor-like protein
MNLQLVKTEKFNDIACDFYSAEDEIWMTRKQIGEALEYSDPKIALSKIHTAHKDRLDKLSKVTDLVTLDNKTRQVVLYNERGVMEICRWSRQPKANAFIDWVWDVIKVYRHGNLRTRTPVTTVERFLTEQTELMKQMERNNERLYKVTIKGFNQLADIVKEMKAERKELYKQIGKPTKDIPVVDTESVIAEYKLNEWKSNVYSIIDDILKESDELGTTTRDILREAYRYLTNTYGIVWEQDRKEYKEKYNISERGNVPTIDLCYDKYPDLLVNSLEKLLRQFRKENAQPDWEEMKIKITNYANHIGNKSKGGTSVYRKIYTKMTENGVNWDEYAHGIPKSQLIKTNATLYNRFYEAAVEIISEE